MNNLEQLAYKDVMNSELTDYATFRKYLSPHYRIAWRDIIIGYVFLAVLFFLSTRVNYSNKPVLVLCIVAGSIMTGFVLAFLSLFLHEAGHYNLHANKRQNDVLSTIFLGLLFGTSIKFYRKIHWQHHLHLGSAEDTETSYFNPLTAGFFAETLTGIYLLKVILKKGNDAIVSKKMKADNFKMLVANILLTLIILTGFFFLHYWASAIIWIMGMFIFFPFFAAMRQLLEHRSEFAKKEKNYPQSNYGKISRLFNSGFFSRAFGGAGFNRHMIHHWDPQISYTRLKDVENFLLDCEKTKTIIDSSKTTYLRTFLKLLRQ